MPIVRSDKVRPARVFSKRREPSATSGSTPDNWVWSALDVARCAAMADDLAYIPSIRSIAEIFTRMLEGLHGMKRNRNNFYVIINEIGILIESVVQYAREREPVSEGYKRVCDDFLSTMSSLQSEMERIFDGSGTHAARLPKAIKYQDILSSYQFRVRRLRSDLRALTVSSPLTSPIGILSNSRDTTITGGIFTEIQGNQYILHNHGTAGIQALLDHTSADQLANGDSSDYRILKYGDLRAISVPRKTIRNLTLLDGKYEWNIMQEYAVRIQNQIMTARTYRGKSSFQFFKDDVKMVLEHNFRHPYIAQLFGVCPSNKVPTLIFHNDLNDLSFDTNLNPREFWHQRFRIYQECQAAFRYLMQEHWLHSSACDFLTQEGQFTHNFFSEIYCIPKDVNFSNCRCHLYVDNYKHLQVSIEPPIMRLGHGHDPAFYSFFPFPKLSFPDMEVIKNTLASNGIIPDSHQIDRKACLLAFYDFLVSGINTYDVHAQSPILISPMRRMKAARLMFNPKYSCFEWSGWVPDEDGPDLDMSRVTVDDNSWTRFTISHKVSTELYAGHPKISCYSKFDASPMYLKTWLAQGERIVSQIDLACTSGSEHVMALVTSVECNIFFQTGFSSPRSLAPEAVYLFLQDLQDIDDVFEIAWFWAKDPDGLEHLSAADMLMLGLGEPLQSKTYITSRNAALDISEDPRIFHELFGFAPDSLNISHFLDLPDASVEWDGDDNGPLTPWESLVWNYDDYYEELNRFLDA